MSDENKQDYTADFTYCLLWLTRQKRSQGNGKQLFLLEGKHATHFVDPQGHETIQHERGRLILSSGNFRYNLQVEKQMVTIGIDTIIHTI